MDVPAPLQRGDPRGEATFQKISEICAYLRAERLYDDGRTIKLTRTASGILISAGERSGGVRDFGGGYDGFFRVDLIEDEMGAVTVSVVDGMDETEDNAGYAYYNAKKVECPAEDGIAVAEGYLCLCIAKTASDYTVTYSIEAAIPDMPTLEDLEDDNTAKYPLAEISGSGEDGWWVRQLHRHGLPQLWCFGPCNPTS